jgi:hypothetical protein
METEKRFEEAYTKIKEETPIDEDEYTLNKEKVETLKIKHKQLVDDYEERTKHN